MDLFTILTACLFTLSQVQRLMQPETMGDVKPKGAPCGNWIFVLAVCGVAWYPDKPTLTEAAHQRTFAGSFPAAAWEED